MEQTKRMGYTQRTVHCNFHLVRLNSQQDPIPKTIYIEIENPEYLLDLQEDDPNRAILQGPVFPFDKKKSLDGQIERRRNDCSARG